MENILESPMISRGAEHAFLYKHDMIMELQALQD